METPKWGKINGYLSMSDDGKYIGVYSPENYVQVKPKGETMFKRTFEVPQKPRKEDVRCGNCSSLTVPAGDSLGICHKTLNLIMRHPDEYCEQHTINQDLFRDEMPDGEEAR